MNEKGYLDPGTGSVIAGSLWPVVVAFVLAVIAFLVKHFWNPIQGFFRKLRESKEKYFEEAEK